MTAEIAIMNKQAVALAADSAVTYSEIEGQKIFPSANKIFSLSKYSPVGIMVFGNASFMGIPWETIIKIYREILNDRIFDSLNQYANHFIDFLKSNDSLFPEDIQFSFFKNKVSACFISIRNDIVNRINKYLEENNEIYDSDIINLSSSIIKQHHDIWENAEYAAEANEQFINKLNGNCKDDIHHIREEIFEELPIDNESIGFLDQIALYLFLNSRLEMRILKCQVLSLLDLEKRTFFLHCNYYQLRD